MKKERKLLRVADLQLNEGQLGWLPKNPRQWTQEDIERMRASIREDPDFIEDRPALVTPCDGGFCVFAHNLYTHAASQERIEAIPCVIYTPESEEDRQTIIRRAMKDNAFFGAWDWDALANEWDDLPLCDWGVPAWKGADGGDTDINGLFDPDKKAPEKGKINITAVIPSEYGGNIEDIKKAIEVTLEQWPGCTVK